MSDELEQRIEVFRKFPLLREADESALAQIAERVEVRQFSEGELLVREGSMGLAVFFVVEGRCEISRGAGNKRKVLATLGPGDFFGEMTVLSPGPRTATVKALGPMHTFVLNAWDFRTVLESNPRIALHMLKVLATRLRKLQEEMSNAQAAAAASAES